MAWSQIFQGIPSRIGQLLVGVSSPDAYIFGGKLLVPSLVRDLLSGWKVQSAAAALGFVALAALTSLYLCKMLFTFEQSRHSVARPAIDSKHAGSTFRLPNLLLPAVALLVVLFLGLTMISPLTMVSAGYGASGPVTGGTPGAYLSIVTPQKFELPTSSGQAVVLTSPGDRLHSLSMSTLRSLDNLDQSGDQVIPGQTKQLSDLEERIFFTSTIAAPHSQVELYVRSKGDGVLALRLGQAGREADSLASTLVPTKELMEGWNTIQLPYNVLEAGKTYFYGLRLASGQQGPELSVDGRAGQIAFRQYYARTPQEVLMSQAAASAGKQVVIGGIPANVTMKIRDDGSGSLRYEAQGSSILLDSVRSQGWQGGGYKGLIYKAGAASGAITYAISSPFPIVGGTASLSIGNYSGEANIQASIAMSKDGVDFEPLPLTIFPDEKNQAVYASLLGQGQKRLFLRFDLTPTSYYFGIDGVTLDLKLDAHGVAAPLSEPEVPWTIQTAGVQGSGIQVNAEVAHRLLYIPAVFEDALGKGARWIGAISYGAWAAGIGILIVALFLRRKKVGRRGVRGST
ncbi:MAG: hypothetical protein Q8P59_08640, partial [Dehalococcoidia bacterium]|nr:hypothetical protein [Dehalococcoidia bacterium]